MTDYEKALADARDALAIYLRYGPPHYGEPLCGYATNAIDALDDLLAALDAAQGEAVAWPKADDSDKELGWSWDYKWLESLADATRAAGWDASMEAIDFVLSRVAAPQAPPAAVPAGYALVPVEPTQAMLDAAGMCIIPDGEEWPDQSNREVWATMLDAATQAPPAAVPAPQPIVRFIDQGDGTVIDNATRLQWSKATLTPTRISQHEALKLCEGLSLAGHGDWRLPTRAELLTLVDDTRHHPAIDTTFFPDTHNDWYWTSTVCAWSSSLAWYVDFSYGYCTGGGVRGGSSGLGRAVRSVPAGQ